MLAATKAHAQDHWDRVKKNYKHTRQIGSILYEIELKTSQWVTKTPIDFSKESFLKHIDFEDIHPEDVFKYINFKKGYIEDEYTLIGDNYWKDETAAFGWDNVDENQAQLVYELAVGGPNAHLIFYYDREDDMLYHSKTEFQYNWWSPTYRFDLTDDPDAEDCRRSIEEEAFDMLED